jgi:hypothetical protein
MRDPPDIFRGRFNRLNPSALTIMNVRSTMDRVLGGVWRLYNRWCEVHSGRQTPLAGARRLVQAGGTPIAVLTKEFPGLVCSAIAQAYKAMADSIDLTLLAARP